MARDPARELADLTSVHAFYVGMLQEVLGHPIPMPAGLTQAAAAQGPNKLAVALNILRRWVNLLELAISPPMVRQALQRNTGQQTAESLLRHYAFKPVRSATDRDKADLVATFLYREATSQPDRLAASKRGMSDRGPEFEKEIVRLLDDAELPPLPEQHQQLAREFQFIRQEVEELGSFAQLMDSGVLDRVRDIKARFGDSFYHPRVLAVVAEHNAFFGHRFDSLFREAARAIKAFAARVQQEGGSMMSRVDGDITVQHLADVEEGTLLQQDYEQARRQFHRVSRYRKAIERRGPVAAPEPAPRPATPFSMGTGAMPEAGRFDIDTLADAPARAVVNTIEDSKLRGMEDSIRNFVRAADPKSAYVVPLRGANLTLTVAEVDAFRADFGNERSFRADYVTLHRHVVAVEGRLISELEEFKAKQDSAYLWKPHADALAYLIAAGRRDLEASDPILATARQRGLTEKVTALNASLQKLRWGLQRAAKTLEGLTPSPPNRW